MAKYLLYFSPEYWETSLWCKNDAAYKAFSNPVEYDELPLSPELRAMLRKFDSGCTGIIDWSDPGRGDIRPADEQTEYYMTGLRLLELVRQELGEDFEVLDGLEWIRPEEDEEKEE